MKSTTRLYLILFFCSLSLIFIGYQMEQIAHKTPDLKSYQNNLQQKIQGFESEIDLLFRNSSFIFPALSNELPRDSILKYHNKPYTLLIYEDNDSLLYWSNNKASPYSSDIHFSEQRTSRLIENAGSQYLFIKEPYELVINTKHYRYTLIAMVPLYLRYPVANNYLDDYFPLCDKEFNSFVEPVSANEDKNHLIYDQLGNALIGLKAKSNYPCQNSIIWSFLFYLLGVLLLFWIIYRVSSNYLKQKGIMAGTLLFAGSLLLLRLITVLLEFPSASLQLDVFELQFSVSNALWFHSLGDFLVDIGLFLAIAVFILQQWKPHYIRRWKPIQQWVFTIGTYSFIIGCFTFIQLVLRDIVLNSAIYFEFEDFSKLDKYSLCALLGIVILFIGFFFISNRAYRILQFFKFPLSTHITVATILLTFAFGLGFFFQHTLFANLYVLFFSVAFIIILRWFSKVRALSFIWLSSWLFFFAVCSTALLQLAQHQKTRQLHASFLKELTHEQDIRVEESFLRIEERMMNDDFFKIYFSSMYIPYNQVVERLTYLYLDNEFFGRYRYNINLYTNNNIPKRPEHLPYEELESLMRIGQKTLSDFLYFYSMPDGRYLYIAEIPIKEKGNTLGKIVLELEPEQNTEKSSIYVELLSLEKTNLEKHYEGLNYALYKNNQRMFSPKGNFPAVLSFDDPIPEQQEYLLERKDDKSYLVYRDQRDYIAKVEMPAASWLSPLSIFSYLFSSGILAIIFLALMTWTLRKTLRLKIETVQFQSSLRERIQQGIVVVSLLSFLAIGIITILYFQSEYTDYHKSRLKRKIGSTAKTATWQIINNKDSVEVIPNAKELANIHKIDVNVYGLNGQLLSSSQDAVFERRLLGRQMHPIAYYKMKYERLPIINQPEVINNFEYLSGYVPLKNSKDEIIAFLNLPYDLAGSKNIRSQDVAQFLGALLNVYVVFLLLAALVAFLIANSVTRPLAVIGEKLRMIKVGEKNDPIDWKSKDEIGDFVARFNDMIMALEKSTQQLARTQRETAWREMAKQVAHEIKNPLTPMKLQIQMLERAAEKDPEKAQKMMKRVSRTLVEQIDNLAHIASEFSNFAKMPTAKNEKFALNPMVEGVFTLFHEEENIQLRLNMCEETLQVFADKSQILRVLNNLVKNAIQAIPEDRPGIVEIGLQQQNGYAVVKVTDNGCGIPEEKKEDIFVPYFTTKSSGTGIGLAMSKNIVEIAKGRIYFESEVDKGTNFYIELPVKK